MAKTKKKGSFPTRKYNRNIEQNYNSRIVTGDLKVGRGVRTNTRGRDVGSMNVSIVTRPVGGTTCKIFDGSYLLNLNGREARTLWLTLDKHFS